MMYTVTAICVLHRTATLNSSQAVRPANQHVSKSSMFRYRTHIVSDIEDLRYWSEPISNFEHSILTFLRYRVLSISNPISGVGKVPDVLTICFFKNSKKIRLLSKGLYLYKSLKLCMVWPPNIKDKQQMSVSAQMGSWSSSNISPR
jgi:hypothetical protein